MSNSYKFIDPDFTYTDPNTGVLRNLADIHDEEVLRFAESGAVTKRMEELIRNPIPIMDSTSLFTVHQ